jgi:hypothetical protein
VSIKYCLAVASVIDVFDYGFKNAGNDTITDFTIGNTKTDHGADIINLASLKLNVIVLAATLAPPLPIIVRIGLIASSTKLPLAIKSVNKLAL